MAETPQSKASPPPCEQNELPPKVFHLQSVHFGPRLEFKEDKDAERRKSRMKSKPASSRSER
eukprot:5230523-Alexandrium_andersonii.AAC.1